MNINGIICPKSKNTFNELVWLYGSMGDNITTSLTDSQKEVVSRAWSSVAIDVEDEAKPEAEIDSVINSYYDDFVKA